MTDKPFGGDLLCTVFEPFVGQELVGIVNGSKGESELVFSGSADFRLNLLTIYIADDGTITYEHGFVIDPETYAFPERQLARGAD